jgi:hypothetical protein
MHSSAMDTVQLWSDPPFPALMMQYIQSWGGSGLVHKTSLRPARALIHCYLAPMNYLKVAICTDNTVILSCDIESEFAGDSDCQKIFTNSDKLHLSTYIHMERDNISWLRIEVGSHRTHSFSISNETL